MLEASLDAGVERFFYSSSACVYPRRQQDRPDISPLREEGRLPRHAGGRLRLGEALQRADVPALPRRTSASRPALRATTTSTGPQGTFEGGREKAPAAICRKIAEAKLSGGHEIEVWGDGEQTRSFMYIDDCVHGLAAAHGVGPDEPINLGSSEMVTINELIDNVEGIAGIEVDRVYDLAPQGVGAAAATTR